MKILILGGTGAMGRHLVYILASENNEIYVTSRKKIKDLENIHYLEGNAKEISFLSEILTEKWDVIVDFMAYTTIEFQDRIELLLRATNHYIFLSSARVYDNSDYIITEETTRLLDSSKDENYLLTDEYALAKARQEDILKKSKYVNWTIIRPYITYAEERLQLGPLEKEYWLYRVLHNKRIVFPKDIFCKKTTLTYGGDVARGIRAIINNNSSFGETYNIVRNGFDTWEKIFYVYDTTLKEVIGRGINLELVSNEKFLECYPIKYQVLYDRLYDRVFDNSKISKVINASKFISHELGLTKCLKVFCQNLTFGPTDWRIHGCMDKVTNEYTEFDEINNEKDIEVYKKYRN